nr:hypothetical protein CFP56_12944 [Quercus suber]
MPEQSSSEQRTRGGSTCHVSLLCAVHATSFAHAKFAARLFARVSTIAKKLSFRPSACSRDTLLTPLLVSNAPRISHLRRVEEGRAAERLMLPRRCVLWCSGTLVADVYAGRYGQFVPKQSACDWHAIHQKIVALKNWLRLLRPTRWRVGTAYTMDKVGDAHSISFHAWEAGCTGA